MGYCIGSTQWWVDQEEKDGADLKILGNSDNDVDLTPENKHAKLRRLYAIADIAQVSNQYFAVPPTVHMDSTEVHLKVEGTGGMESTPLHSTQGYQGEWSPLHSSPLHSSPLHSSSNKSTQG